MKTSALNKLIAQALREDMADKDITTRCLIPPAAAATGYIVVKENAVLCGLPIAKKIFQKLDRNVRFSTPFKDGSWVRRNTRIATVKGKTRALLTGERAALNFLGYLCGIATATHAYVREIRATKAVILDTRKTTPGLRALEKYAVRCGGGHNHRFDLRQMALIKDNHREACAPRLDIPRAVERMRAKTKKPVEVEVDNLAQF